MGHPVDYGSRIFDLAGICRNYETKVREIAAQIGLSPGYFTEEVNFQEEHFLLSFHEEYFTVHLFPDAKYIGFDVMLWYDSWIS